MTPTHHTINTTPAARHYDSGLSLWLSVDPMLDKYPGVSPYVYCGDNPVALKDPDGRTIYDIYGERKRIADGHDNVTVDNVTFNQFDKLQKAFNRHHLHRYERLRNRYKTHNGYTVIETLIQASPDKDGFNTAPLVHSTHHDGKPYLGEKISAFFRRIDEGGSGDYQNRRFAKKAEPYATEFILLLPPVSFTNSVTTIRTGHDIYGNPADGVDYTSSIIGTVLGPSSFFQNVPKAIQWLDKINTLFSFGYYVFKSHKDENKKGN